MTSKKDTDKDTDTKDKTNIISYETPEDINKYLNNIPNKNNYPLIKIDTQAYHTEKDNNNVIYVNGVKLAYIDKINQKTGQEKSNWEIKKYADGGYIKQNSWRNSGEGNLSVEETKQIAEKYAQALSTLYNQEFSVNPSVEENSFDLDIDGMAYEGGSYLIYGDGSVVNVAVNPNSRLWSTKSSINEIIGKIIDLKNQYGNAQFETLKRADGSVYGRKISSEIKYDDGGEVDNIKSDLNKYKNVDIRFKLIPNDGSEEDGDENDLSLNYVGEIYGGGIDSDEPFVELGFQVNDEQDETGNFNLKSDLNK